MRFLLFLHCTKPGIVRFRAVRIALPGTMLIRRESHRNLTASCDQRSESFNVDPDIESGMPVEYLEFQLSSEIGTNRGLASGSNRIG